MTLKNSNIQINAKFCTECGNAVALKRNDHHFVMQEIGLVLHLENKASGYTKEFAAHILEIISLCLLNLAIDSLIDIFTKH